jgi:hypothetical protein
MTRLPVALFNYQGVLSALLLVRVWVIGLGPGLACQRAPVHA